MGALTRMVHEWTDAVNDLLPTLHGHTRKALASFSYAMCVAGHCHSGPLAASVPSQAKPASSRRRWERLLANDALDGSATLLQLSESVLKNLPAAGQRPKVLLVLDETPNGEGLRSLRLGLAYRKRLLNLAAYCYPTGQLPCAMPRLICRMIKEIAQLLPPDAIVTFLCDRGLAWPSVMDEVCRHGWDHVLRLQRTTRVKTPDGKVVAAGSLVKRAGAKPWQGRAVIFKKAGWREAYVTVVWDKRAKEPWILAARSDSNKRGLRAACAYAKRNWCEQTFRDEKSHGFHWHESHVTDATRAMKLVLVMTLATLLSISLGTWLIKAGHRRDLDPHHFRRLSVFQLGMRWLQHLLVHLGDSVLPPHLPYLYPK